MAITDTNALIIIAPITHFLSFFTIKARACKSPGLCHILKSFRENQTTLSGHSTGYRTITLQDFPSATTT